MHDIAALIHPDSFMQDKVIQCAIRIKSNDLEIILTKWFNTPRPSGSEALFEEQTI